MDALVTRLALHRMDFLRPSERARLSKAVAEGLDLSRLGFSALELLLGRLLGLREWDPAALVALASRDAEFLERRGIRYISDIDQEYPPLLREIHDPPCGLFAMGAPLQNLRPSLAVVGTRSASRRGLDAAVGLARDLALAGLPIVSGLARGIDAAAHRGALAAARLAPATAAPTIAVLPIGIDSIYPPSHRGLAAAILEKGGTLISEYPPETALGKWRFPERNRVIAGMARGTLVVEAPAESGALITSTHALDAGRDVFVAAATLSGPMNAGADRLAAEGALALTTAEDLLAEWGLAAGDELAAAREAAAAKAADLGDEEGFLAASLRAELGLGPDEARRP